MGKHQSFQELEWKSRQTHMIKGVGTLLGDGPQGFGKRWPFELVTNPKKLAILHKDVFPQSIVLDKVAKKLVGQGCVSSLCWRPDEYNNALVFSVYGQLPF